MTDVLKTLGNEVDQFQTIENQVRAEIRKIRPEGSDASLAALGTPPKAMEAILKSYGAQIEVKSSETEITPGVSEASEEWLEQKLREGYAIITPVQTIPNYGKERNINDDGHYLIVCGVVTIEGKKNYITVDPMFHYYQRGSNEGWVYGMHAGRDNAKKAGMPKRAKEKEYETVETREIGYWSKTLDKFDIDPKKYGLRLIAASNFMRNWRDVSGFGEPYNHYGIAVKMLQDAG